MCLFIYLFIDRVWQSSVYLGRSQKEEDGEELGVEKKQVNSLNNSDVCLDYW